MQKSLSSAAQYVNRSGILLRQDCLVFGWWGRGRASGVVRLKVAHGGCVAVVYNLVINTVCTCVHGVGAIWDLLNDVCSKKATSLAVWWYEMRIRLVVCEPAK